jgi:hypothetical protein
MAVPMHHITPKVGESHTVVNLTAGSGQYDGAVTVTGGESSLLV